MKKLRKPRNKKRSATRRKRSATTTAIVPVQKTAAIVPQSAIPQIEQTVQNMERVRRFVSKCLNTDLQRALSKLAGEKNLAPDARAKRETELRQRLEIDWGTIPGVDKPFLMQPGAEKFLFWLNLRPKFTTKEIELPGGHLEMIASVTVYSKKTGEEVFEGPSCSCSTMESNFRFRWAERDTKPEIPPDEEAKRLKAAGLGKFRKKTIWAHGKKVEDKWVWLDRVENPNIHDERNKVRQIGEKRALVKCVKNMGAISEIFTADPSEWEIPEQEGSPYDDQDFTPSGRKIYTQDGVSGSGRYEDPKMKTKDTRERGPRTAPAPPTNAPPDSPAPSTAPPAAKPTLKTRRKITLTWPEPKDGCAYLRGDFLSLLPIIQKEMLCTFIQSKQAYAIVAGEANKIYDLASTNDYDYEEITSSVGPTPDRPKATEAPQSKAEANLTPASASGVIKTVEQEVDENNQIKMLRIHIGTLKTVAFDKKLFQFLIFGMGKDAELILASNKRSIVGIKRIGTRTFTEGHIPEIQLGEDRPKDTASLFS